MTKSKQILSLTLVAFTLLASSCAFAKHRETAEKAVDTFHNQLNAGQFQEIYAHSGDEFKKAVSEADAVALFDAVHRKLGMVKQANSTSWRVGTAPFGAMTVLAYDVEFTEGKGTEQFVFQMKDNKALLVNYNINSPLLITK
ncbi:MAG TPA: hypothetical protein VJ875_09270 [Pyrinomonadaceae bacterium]|nr:hypothetical protein [Pyrinomonadaceae bacterium]